MTPRQIRSLSEVCLGLLIATGSLVSPVCGEPIGPSSAVRGVVISCQTWGPEWGSDAMVEAMRDVKALGANWVQIHPYVGATRAGYLRSYGIVPGSPAPEWISRPIREAHRLGLKICIAPHVAPWRGGWRWRGEIDFDDDEKWGHFFADYRAWIVNLARICREADAFVVGSELDQTVESNAEDWRQIIAAVRQETDVPLVYAANWPDYRRVPFWDALDAIGISAYFPVSSGSDVPTDTAISRAWERIKREVTTFSEAQKRPVIFMELGYDTGLNVAREPWREGDGARGGEELQARCLDHALAAVSVPGDDLVGAFLWKWFPGDSRGENFLISEPHMQAVVARHWRETAEIKFP